jgi:hypothetical protein
MQARVTTHLLLAGAFAATLVACDDDHSDTGPPSTSPASSVVTRAPVAVTTEPGRPTAAEASYGSTSFVMPFEVMLPEWVARAPVTEKPNLVTWEGAEVDRAIRFLVPGVVYPPGETAPTPVPDDYLDYLLAQSDHGAVFEDVVETTVDGLSATIVTATTPRNLVDSIGCTEENNMVTDCFGLLSDLILRIAVLDTANGPLLVWVRDTRGATGEPEYDTFDAMLSSLHFRPDTTPVSEASEPSGEEAGDPRLPEGDYRTPELTRDQLIATGVAAGFAEDDVQAMVDAALPQLEGTVTWGLRLADGAWTEYQMINAGPAEAGWRGTYEVLDEDTVVATDAVGEDGTVTYTYHVDGEALTLDVVDTSSGDVGGEIVWTVIVEAAPFTPQ